MPYILTEFSGALLPLAVPSDDLSTGKVDSTLDQSIGGVFDSYGTNRRYPGRHEFSHRGKYEAGPADQSVRITKAGDTRLDKNGNTRVAANIPAVSLQYQTDALKALIGQRGPLWRQRIWDGARQWKSCRLLEVRHVETVENAGVVSDVQSTYETAINSWREAAVLTVSGSAANGITLPLTIYNNGLLPVHDAILTVARTSGTINSVTVSGVNINFTWSGSIGAGQTLTIDAGSQTVQRNGVDAYSGFVLGPTVADRLPLALGAQVLYVTVTGGNATVSLSYYQQWP